MFEQLFNWLVGKKAQGPPRSYGGADIGFMDAYKRVRNPSQLELLQELKNTAYVCANLNATACASYPPKLYVRTRKGQEQPKCLTKSLHPSHPLRLQHKGYADVEEVIEHPLLELLKQVNPRHNGHDLWELTTLYQETGGNCYWLIQFDGFLKIPSQIWPLPAYLVTAKRGKDSKQIVDYYEYRIPGGGEVVKYTPEEIIHFAYPDPRDPYLNGLSPLRACFESAALSSQYLAYKRSIWDNNALPGAIISPDEVISEEEADRLETKWNQRFRRGGNGRVVVAESALTVEQISNQLGDVVALAESSATKEDIANAYGVPLAYLTSETNLANLDAADRQHAKAIYARLIRRDEKINEQLIPLYDATGRLFVASDDPRPDDKDFNLRRDRMNLMYGVKTINELRARDGDPPVPWGNEPFKPTTNDTNAEKESPV